MLIRYEMQFITRCHQASSSTTFYLALNFCRDAHEPASRNIRDAKEQELHHLPQAPLLKANVGDFLPRLSTFATCPLWYK